MQSIELSRGDQKMGERQNCELHLARNAVCGTMGAMRLRPSPVVLCACCCTVRRTCG